MGQNLYNYKPPKSQNEEEHFFLSKGRITLKAFLLRFLLVLAFILAYLIYQIKLSTNNSLGIFEVLFLLFLIFFLVIQAVKRIHDVNRSGWYALVPGYNLVLLFSKGTIGNNDYGIDPNPQPKVTYFDELDKTNEIKSAGHKSYIYILTGLILFVIAVISLLWMKNSEEYGREENENRAMHFCLPLKLNVRDSKNDTSKQNIIGSLKYGDSIEVVSEDDPFWYEIKYEGGSRAFVDRRYLVDRENFKVLTNFSRFDTSFASIQSENKIALLNLLKTGNNNRLTYLGGKNKGEFILCKANDEKYLLIYDKNRTKYELKSQYEIEKEQIREQVKKEEIRQKRIKNEKIEEAIRQADTEQERKKNNFKRNWRNYITVDRSSYNYNELLGGISNLSITVTNNSDYIIDNCSVQHDIIKKNGDVYETIYTHFSDIPPHSWKRICVKDSNRGIKISEPVIYQIYFD